jgi:general secretion pathway protein A
MALAAPVGGDMYVSFYGLREAPFNVTPDPRFLYLNDCYQDALSALDHGIAAREGFVSLIGEAGTGKTTLLRRLLDGLEPRINAVLLLNPRVSFDEILEYMLLELGVPANGADTPARLARLNEALRDHARAGENVALLIDDAQLLDDEVLQGLHVLAGREPAGDTTLQLVLAGQPELDAKLSDPALGGFASRVRLRALSPAEVHVYVRTRLERAGARDPDLFTAPALDRIATLSEGVPRVVNTLCDAALLNAFTAGHPRVSAAVVEGAWRDYAGIEPPTSQPERLRVSEEPMEEMARQAAELVGFGREIDRHIRNAGISGIDGVVSLYDQLRAALGKVSRPELEKVHGQVNGLLDDLRRFSDQLARLLAIASVLEPSTAPPAGAERGSGSGS